MGPGSRFACPGRRKVFSDSTFKDLTCLRILAARFARGLQIVSPQKRRGRRECRVLAAPAVSCANVHKGNAHEHTGTDGAFRHSLRNGFTAYTVLSPATNSSCHRRRRIEDSRRPGWAFQNLRRLDTSNGCQDHTVLPSAASPFVWRAAFAHGQARPAKTLARPALPRPPHPAPYVRDDRDTPLLWARDGKSFRNDLGEKRSGIFLRGQMKRFALSGKSTGVVASIRHARACPGHPRPFLSRSQRRGWPGQARP